MSNAAHRGRCVGTPSADEPPRAASCNRSRCVVGHRAGCTTRRGGSARMRASRAGILHAVGRGMNNPGGLSKLDRAHAFTEGAPVPRKRAVEAPRGVRLLSDILEEEARLAQRGRLTIFFGFAPGVGKTTAMLRAAHDLRDRGVDVAAAWIETHGRPETEALARGVERVASRGVDDEGIMLDELDLDAVLARRPEVALVDELAHTNAPGTCHARRYQDVLALLDAGIDVLATLNVQHVESLNDVIERVTGVRVRETVPDSIIERADEVEVIDLPPDDLLRRLHEGKIHVNEQAQRAVAAFFRKGNLLALRELTLRRAAQRVDEEVRGYRREHGIADTWAAGERIAVSVGPSPSSRRLVCTARRMAGALGAPWYAIFVETRAFERLEPEDRARVEEHLALAERLGGTPVRLRGKRVAPEIVSFARRENVTQIVVGKPTHPRWRDFVHGSLLDELLRSSGDIGIYAIDGDSPPPKPRTSLEPSDRIMG
ncbi:Osmosensitive K+ channel histidine kinase KdpD [Minicystis rosea]|nr:Osmosensitive K+ channel histidine kinase KdpD [Minicystis rosea]